MTAFADRQTEISFSLTLTRDVNGGAGGCWVKVVLRLEGTWVVTGAAFFFGSPQEKGGFSDVTWNNRGGGRGGGWKRFETSQRPILPPPPPKNGALSMLKGNYDYCLFGLSGCHLVVNYLEGYGGKKKETTKKEEDNGVRYKRKGNSTQRRQKERRL